jgi:tetratricopeptide (TPR) repeat protein
MDQLSATLDRGWDLAQRGDAMGAVACARRALEMDPQSPEVHNLLGYSAALAGDTDEAVEHYRQALALDESYFEAMLNCAELLVHPLEEWDEAIVMCEQALDISETEEEVYDCTLIKVSALIGKKEPDLARRALGTISGGPFENPGHAFMVGRAHFDLGDHELARPLLEEAVRRDGGHADAHYHLGVIEEEAGHTRRAQEHFLRVRLLDAQLAPPPWAPGPEVLGPMVHRVVSTLDALLARHVREAEVFVVDLPGAELIADGVDPRSIAIVLDMPGSDPDGGLDRPACARLFVYQRNLERAAGTLERMEDELRHAIEHEVASVFGDAEPADRLRLN